MPIVSSNRHNLKDNKINNPRKYEPVVIVGGFMSSPRDYMFWQTMLASAKYGIASRATNIGRRIWLRTRQSNYGYQINALDYAVEQVRRDTDAEKVWLVCHSAGGLIARLWMGDYQFDEAPCNGHQYVRGVVFLGSPYNSQEPHAQEGVKFANQHYPGAYYSDIKYLSLIGRSVFGQANGSIAQRIAYSSYRKLDPEHPNQWGDGVVTLGAAHVPGAANFMLENVYHLDLPRNRGYGSREVVDFWTRHIHDSDSKPALEGVA